MQSRIRNFAIIAHIDHCKSTLADRLLEMTGTVPGREMQEQILDSNPIERERGITIKLAPVRMTYRSRIMNHESRIVVENQPIIHNSKFIIHEEYILNLIDTPGHVDFAYEVSRSLAACEGAILVVDATQGVQAQTIANLAAARAHGLAIIPVINKIDMPHARIPQTRVELVALGFRDEEMMEISAKTGQGVGQLLEAVLARIRPPSGEPDRPLRALVFSSQFDAHKGVVVFVRVVDGSVGGAGSGALRFMAGGAVVTPIEVGYFAPKMTAGQGLACGEVGYIATGLKDIRLANVGDTITIIQNSNFKIQNEKFAPLPGYREPKPMVFLSLFPVSSDEWSSARGILDKLRLSDSAFTYRPIASAALGNGFHCGFLGLLHAEIVQERLSREFGLNMIATSPSVAYRIKCKNQNAKLKIDDDGYISIDSAAEFPDPSVVEEVQEPVMEVKIFTPKAYVGAVMQIADEKRGEYMDLGYMGEQATLTYLMPLADMIIDFFDRLKSISEGYASLDYEFFGYQAVDVAKVDILVNHEPVDALAFLAVRSQARHRSIAIVDRLAEVIPRQQFAIPVQGAIGGEIVARADVKPFRKDVTAKLYGGDRTRKDKLLKKQAKGKARMKMVGRVAIPQSAFFDLLKRE